MDQVPSARRPLLLTPITVLAALFGALRLLFVLRRIDLAGGWADALRGLALGALNDAGVALVLGGVLAATARRWPRLAKAFLVATCLVLAGVGAVQTEYFAWSRHRIDSVFLAYVSQWRTLSGSVAVEISPRYLAAHAALGLVTAVWAVGAWKPTTARGPLSPWGSLASGTALLALLWWINPGSRTWFGAMAGSSALADLRPRVASAKRRPLASEERASTALQAVRDFSNPFQAKRFVDDALPFVHLGGAAPAGTWTRPVAHPNVILLLLEGMEASNLSAAGGHAGLTPHLDALAEEGLFFNHFFSNGTHTPRALDASLCGLYPRLLGTTTSISQPDLPLHCLPSILAERGYRTSFVHGGLIDFENRRTYLPHLGFGELHFFEQFGADATIANAGWGATDAATYDQALGWVDARPPAQPFFLTVLSISNHHPFEVPDPALATEHDRALLSNNTVRYADREAGRFIEELRRRGLLENSYLFILGDHGLDRKGAGGDAPAALGAQLMRRTHVPLIVLGPAVPRRKISALASQVDLMPTILDLLGMDPPNHAMGQSLGWTLPPNDHDLPVFVHDVYSEVAATITPRTLESYPLDDSAWERALAAGQSQSAGWQEESDGRFIVNAVSPDNPGEQRVRQIVATVDSLYAERKWWRSAAPVSP